MQNFIQEKRGLCFTAPAGGVVSGLAYVVGSVFGVAKVTAPAGATFAMETQGVVMLPVGNVAIAEGTPVYWDATNAVVTATAGSNLKIGYAALGGCVSGIANAGYGPQSGVPVALNGTV